MTRRRHALAGGRRSPAAAILTLLGWVLVIAGLLFVGQGSGWFPYPRQSFMVGASPWITRGAAIAVAGCVLLFLARIARRR